MNNTYSLFEAWHPIFIPSAIVICIDVDVLPRMAALRYFLHQDDLKAGDTGSAAQLEAQKEEEEHIKLIQVDFYQWMKSFQRNASKFDNFR